MLSLLSYVVRAHDDSQHRECYVGSVRFFISDQPYTIPVS